MRKDNVPLIKSVAKAGVLIVAAMLLLSALAWVRIPAGTRVPVHWNAGGQVDRYGSRFEGLMVMPLVSLFMAALLAFLPLFEPRRSNLLKSSRAYFMTCLAVLVFLLIMHSAMVLTALGRDVSVPGVTMSAAGVIFIVIGNYLGKTRSNFFYGIRTPWTLSSELSWARTHRLGGKLFMLLGVVLLASVFFLPPAWLIGILMVGLIGLTVLLMVYSYVVWKNDPNKEKK